MMGSPFPGLWNFDHHPWLKEMHDCSSELVVGQKAAQMGYTETALNRSFKKIDIDAASVIYVLPAMTPDATDFSNSRFDPAIEKSEHLKALFSNTRNTGLKRAGDACLFIRGSRSRSQMKSIPAGDMVFDEVEEMVLENVALAFERMSGQIERSAFMLSTPRFAKIGINKYFEMSDQRSFFFKCPNCNKLTTLVEECLIVTADAINDQKIKNSHIICKECKNKLNHESKMEWLKNGFWVPAYSDRIISGYYINQLYSMVLPPWKIAESKIKAESSPSDEQEYWNSKMGLPHEPEGSRITDANIEDCMGTYVTLESATSGLITMGVDVGKWIHYEIDRWHVNDNIISSNDPNVLAKCQVLKAGKVKQFEELYPIIAKYYVRFVCIDSEPEHRKSLEFAQKIYGMAKLIRFTRGITGRMVNEDNKEEEHLATVDRTSWMDVAFTRFFKNSIVLPKDISIEYRNHLKANVRSYKRDRDDNLVGTYVKDENTADHYALARVYAEIALKFAISLNTSKDITEV
jgi:transcription elongation factor Elf1